MLPSGRVVIAGGTDGEFATLASAELYDPATRRWGFTGSMATARSTFTGTLLADGRFLVAGGQNGTLLDSAEIYNPATRNWSMTGSMSAARVLHAAVLLNTGQVLVAGGVGIGTGTSYVTTAELYDPVTGAWTLTGSPQMARSSYTLTLLSDGRVLAAGGQFKNIHLNEAEIYDPATGAWTVIDSFAVGRSNHTATLLPNGQVLLAGGYDGRRATASAQLYDSTTGLWKATNSLPTPRYGHRATVANGSIVLTGDVSTGAPDTWAAYDTASATWTKGRMKGSHSNHTATLLNDGTILVAGGTLTPRVSSEIGAITP